MQCKCGGSTTDKVATVEGKPVKYRQCTGCGRVLVVTSEQPKQAAAK